MSDLVSTTVTVETLPVITYQGARVITTDLLAQLYGTQPENIYKNFSRNQDRFVAGKHYYKLEGKSLKEFKEIHCLSQSQAVEISPRARNITLWTDRGSARHAKILETNEAWDVYELMEDAYFRVPSDASSVPALPALITVAQQGELATLIAERFPDGKNRPYAWSRFNNHFRISRYRDLPADRFEEACVYIQIMPGAKEQAALPAPTIDPELTPISDRLAYGRFLATFDNNRLHLREIEHDAYVMADHRWPNVIRQQHVTTEVLLDLLDAVAAKLNRRAS